MKKYLSLRENNKLEAKKARDILPKNIFETYSAFANTNGGVILLGVSEDKDKKLFITGVENTSKVLDEFWSGLNNSQKVSKNLLNDEDIKVIYEDNMEYIEINVPRANNEVRPIYLNDNIKNSYKRNYSGDYKSTAEEIRGMIRDNIADLDSKVLEAFNINDFDMDSVNRYRIMFKQLKEKHIFNSLDDISFLESVRAIKIVDEIPKLTVAGLLFFGKEYKIVQQFPAYFLDYQERMTDNPNVRYTDRIYSSTGDWSGNIFDFYFRVVGRLLLDIELPFELQENSVHRISETIMHNAVREGLANCLVNADFTYTKGLVIKKTYNQIIFENPGALRISIEQAFKGGISDPRNVNILHMFNLVNVGEKAGSGIPTIKKAFEDNEFIEPFLYDEFNPNRTFLKLSFVKVNKMGIEVNKKIEVKIDNLKLTNQEYEIVMFLSNNKEITRRQVEEILDFKQRRANNILNQMIDKDIIRKVGGSSSTKYVLK